MPVDEALAVLNSTASGLSAAEAGRRLGEFGPNRIEAPPGRPLWLRFADEFTHFFALVLWLAAGLALTAESLAPVEGMLELAAAIVGVIVVNGSFSFWREYRAERALEAMRRLLPQRIEVLRDGVPRRVDAADVVPGDVVLLAAGDRVPADCRLTEAFAVRADLSTLSGESMAMTRTADPDAQPNNRLVGTAPLPTWVWFTCIPLSLAMGVAEEVRKAVVRVAQRRPRALTAALAADGRPPTDRAPRRTR